MFELLYSRIKPLLDIYDKLKPVLKLPKINDPKIITCGMRLHGKSRT